MIDNATWDNLFVGIDSGKTDVGISNITDTEQRKEKYDFASYRQDNLGFEVTKASTWNFDGNYENLAGQDRCRRLGHQPGEDPAGVADQAEGRGQDAGHQVLPDQQLDLPGAELGQDRRLLRPEPGDRVPRRPDRDHTRPDPQRRNLFRCRRHVCRV